MVSSTVLTNISLIIAIPIILMARIPIAFFLLHICGLSVFSVVGIASFELGFDIKSVSLVEAKKRSLCVLNVKNKLRAYPKIIFL
ncbi:MAG: hypothetical protein H0W19_07765 [Nitrosopumilus sp.]|nr:hypothetical protein [Nitrosopumilus sp.]